ncbi:DUF4436 family protein [Humibacter sp. RRB41]|uniref:DUF4436 family protein n=1 Tax=Humibacter sp. RRB41 TaxID=2919946 RepID=UPI001FAA0BCC|nr:DUF4436 family protein [Humibacter sp. RRB41]
MGDGAGDRVDDGAGGDAMNDVKSSALAGPSVASRRRVPRLLLVLIAAFVVVYAAVVTLYALSGRVTSLGPTEPEPESGGVTVVLTVESVDAAHQRADMSVTIDASDALYSGDKFSVATDIHVIVAPVQGSQVITFPARSAPETKEVSVLTGGEIENWPFDRYHADHMLVLAYVTTDGVSRPIPTSVWFKGEVPGWSVDVAGRGKPVAEAPQTLGEAIAVSQRVELSAVRSGSTIAFAFVLLALLVTMPCLVLFVAITAFRGRRKLEPSFMGWMGAMLFATIPLRTFLPGSPPIGSWIDFTVVLWVVVGLIAGLTIYVAAWARWSRPHPAP